MLPEPKIIESYNADGIAVIPAVLPPPLVELLRTELEAAMEEDAVNYPDVFDKGMVHNCMVRGPKMANLLENQTLNSYLNACFSDTCIVYAYQSSSLPPNQGNYGSRVHVDSPRFIPGYSTNMGVMFPLNDFTEANGATYYARGSHLVEELPSNDEFFATAQRAYCKAGDMILLNPRLVHAAGVNQTQTTRHALTIDFCRSYMRQRFDLPRLIPQEIINGMGKNALRLIGMNVRVPTSLDDFYLPVEQRLYKPNQG